MLRPQIRAQVESHKPMTVQMLGWDWLNKRRGSAAARGEEGGTSTDRSALPALQSKTKASLLYFELVELRFSGDSLVCYLCVGQHALYIVLRHLFGMFPDAEGGQSFYAHMGAWSTTRRASATSWS